MVLMSDPLRTVSESLVQNHEVNGDYGVMWMEDLGLPGLTASYDIWILLILLII